MPLAAHLGKEKTGDRDRLLHRTEARRDTALEKSTLTPVFQLVRTLIESSVVVGDFLLGGTLGVGTIA